MWEMVYRKLQCFQIFEEGVILKDVNDRIQVGFRINFFEYKNKDRQKDEDIGDDVYMIRIRLFVIVKKTFLQK